VVKTQVTKAALPEPRRRLLELMQEVNYGRIEGLVVRNGQPTFTPPPRIIREVKFGGDNSPRRDLASADFLLKDQIIDLFCQLDSLGEGVIEVLEIKAGLPFRAFLPRASA
jgi:hypothetical protein